VAKKRVYSPYCIEAIVLLSKQIKLARKQRKWSEHELAERANISRATLQKIEKGELSCAIGLVFEVANLVGIKLFDSDYMSLRKHIEGIDDKIALLPKYVRENSQILDDDF
jgi:transcriptional regulator with XRE-family HTH domain